jgi:hypothetical protein
MRSRTLFTSIGIFALLTVTLACSLIRTSGPQSSSTLPAASTAVQNGIPISATPIKFVIPPGLGRGVIAKNMDVVTDQTGASWEIAPAHLQLTIQGYAFVNSYFVPQLFVYPAQEYSAVNPTAAEGIKRLQAVLASPNAQYANDVLPYIPFYNAGQVFAAQEEVMQFTGGSGLRAVTQYAQDVSPINNSGLFYHFEGLTADGKYYIIAVLPLNLPFLAGNNDPVATVPAGGIPFPPNNASGSSFQDYFKQVTALINSAPADQFNPTMGTLDDLIQSISIQ